MYPVFIISEMYIKKFLFGLFGAPNLCIRTKQETTVQETCLFSAVH